MRTLRIGALLAVTLSLLVACSSGGGGSGDKAAFCNVIKRANADPSLKSSAGNAKERTAKTQKIYDDLAANAPSDISGDVGVIKDAYAKYAKDPAAFQKDAKATKKVQTASTHLETYSKDKCKLPIGSG
jgi:hypothetical protein